MKKYVIPMVAFLLIGGIASAQTTPAKTSTSHSVAKVSKPANSKPATSTTSVSPQSSGAQKKTNNDAAIKRKHHHKKGKSVPVSNK